MEPYDAIADSYDREHAGFEDDIEFYRSLIQEGPVLEIGVGSGRVAAALIEEGFEVWGIDPSTEMLDRARRRVDPSSARRLIQQRVEELALEQRFAVVLFSLNALWHVTQPDAQRRALERARSHCESGALLVVDSSNPLTMADRHADGLVRQRFVSRTPTETVLGHSAVWDDPAEQTLDMTLWYDVSPHGGHVQRHITQLRLRYLFRHELELLLQLTGFTRRQTYGSYDLDPYSSDSPNLLVVAEAT